MRPSSCQATTRRKVGDLVQVLLTQHDEVIQALLLDRLHEPFRECVFTDAWPDSGYFGTIARLNHIEADRSVAGTSVAQQVSHAAFVMDTATALLQRDSVSPSVKQWEASWQSDALDSLAWQRLQEELRGSYGRLRSAIQSHAVSDAEAFGTVVGTIAHVAYHLAAIKQKIAVLKETG